MHIFSFDLLLKLNSFFSGRESDATQERYNSQELENFLLRDNIYIEWVRIREFKGSGGRIELNDFDAWLKMQSKPEGLARP